MSQKTKTKKETYCLVSAVSKDIDIPGKSRLFISDK